MMEQVIEICRQNERQLVQLLEQESRERSDIIRDISSRLDVQQQRSIQREAEHAEAFAMIHAENTRLVGENDKLLTKNRKLEEDKLILNHSIKRLTDDRSAAPSVLSRPPLQEQSPNRVSPAQTQIDCERYQKLENELRAQQQKYTNLKAYNEQLATKYRRERAIWRQWTDHAARRSSAPTEGSVPQRALSTESPLKARIDRVQAGPVKQSPRVKSETVTDLDLQRDRSTSETTEELTITRETKTHEQVASEIQELKEVNTSTVVSKDEVIRPYAEVVRGREARRKLHASDCPCCSRFYELAGPGAPQQGPIWKTDSAKKGHKTNTDTKQEVGRHRTRFHRSPTPPIFWQCDFPTTQELAVERQRNEQKRSRQQEQEVKSRKKR